MVGKVAADEPDFTQAVTIHRDLERALNRAVLSVDLIPEGHSGFTYWVRLGEGEAGVLRLPPPGARIAGPADIPRQGRVMKALNEFGLPAPRIMSMSDEPIVDGRPFVLMAAINGARIEALAGSVPSEDLAHAAVDLLLRIQSVPHRHTGLGHEAPVTLSAELKRWTWLTARAPKELTGRASHLAQLLASSEPPPRQPTLVHGDYHYGNLLFRDRRIVGILDWEIAELGQPLLDLACLSVVSQGGQSGEGVPGGGRVDVPDELLLEAYGADPGEFRWYRALTYYKYAAIFGYNLTLHRRGKRIDPVYERRTQTIVEFIAEGIRLLS